MSISTSARFGMVVVPGGRGDHLVCFREAPPCESVAVTSAPFLRSGMCFRTATGTNQTNEPTRRAAACRRVLRTYKRLELPRPEVGFAALKRDRYLE